MNGRVILSFIAVALLAIGVYAQKQKVSASARSRQRVVSLDTVLSCTNDSFLGVVFKTDRNTAIRLSRIAMAVTEKDKSDYPALLSKGFVTYPAGQPDSMEIWPTDDRGVPTDESQLPFCRYRPTANYSASFEAGPHGIDIDGRDWFLNPNEVFAHADQFTFDSGVFTDSSRVYLVAKKGRVIIQFLANPSGLRFYRAIYLSGN